MEYPETQNTAKADAKKALDMIEQIADDKEQIAALERKYNNHNFRHALALAAIAINETLSDQYDINDLYDALGRGACEIVFTKADGTKRTARATANPTINQTGRKSPADSLVFWDVEKMAIRSCKVDKILEFSEVK